jgi:hypothetical protein
MSEDMFSRYMPATVLCAESYYLLHYTKLFFSKQQKVPFHCLMQVKPFKLLDP